MKLDKAIKILTIWKEECSYDNQEELEEAEKLGIEALKKVKAVREGKEWVGINPLPGETTE